jgi:hypothetical protein
LIAVAQAEQDGLLIVAADGQGADRLIGTVVGIEDTLLGHVYKSGQPALIADVRQDERRAGRRVRSDWGRRSSPRSARPASRAARCR